MIDWRHFVGAVDERRRAEQAFAEARDCVIVSTSTLELGIDVGGLDRVIQIDAPATVASFLQHPGRTGRRSGALRNCLFLAFSREGLLDAAALLLQWSRGWVEPVVVHPEATLIVCTPNDLRWWTWAGHRANATLAATLEATPYQDSGSTTAGCGCGRT